MSTKLNASLAKQFDIDPNRIRGCYLTSNHVEVCDLDRFHQGVMIVTDGDVATIGYVSRDDDAADFWSSSSGLGELTIFSSEKERNKFSANARKGGGLPLVVDNYRHSTSHWSIQGTVSYPHQGIDTAPRGVYLPDSSVVEQYTNSIKTGIPRDMALERVVKQANQILNQYSLHSNGEVFCVNTETLKLDRETMTFDSLDHEVCGGYIGIMSAVNALQEAMPKPAPELETSLGIGM